MGRSTEIMQRRWVPLRHPALPSHKLEQLEKNVEKKIANFTGSRSDLSLQPHLDSFSTNELIKIGPALDLFQTLCLTSGYKMVALKSAIMI